MKILAIDTSSKICSVAILENDKLVDEVNRNNGFTHSENLMPILAEILKRNEMKLSQFEVLACCTGPGSFTGIRIGVSTVKAIAEANNLPVVGVMSLEILARIDTSNRKKVALIDARNNQVYGGIFDEKYQRLENFMADDIRKVIEVLKKYENMVCIGDGAILHKNLLWENLKNIEFSDLNEQRASFCGKVAYQKYLKNEFEEADTIVPCYLRKSQAERNKDVKNRN